MKTKSFITTVTTAILLLFSSCSCSDNNKLVGEWTSTNKYGSVETSIFKDDGSMVVIKNNKVQDFDFEDKSVKYEVDNSKTPYWLDMIIYDKKNNEEIMRVKGIYEFLSDNTFRLCINGGKHDLEKSLQRPSSFDDEHTTVFTRK